jgi:hypothetical protein
MTSKTSYSVVRVSKEVAGRCANTPSRGRFLRGGTDMAERKCSIPDCPNPHTARGWCAKHYQRWAHTGDPLTPGREQTPLDRFWKNVQKTAGCWVWQGAVSPSGYGYFNVVERQAKRNFRVHRWAYRTLVGPIPEGMQLHHTCKNKRCVNPEHLQLVTPRQHIELDEAVLSGINARKTECIHGHPFDEENTYYSLRDGRVVRGCRTCRRDSGTRFRHKRIPPERRRGSYGKRRTV